MSLKKPTKVPKALGETYAAITAITDDFCRPHLKEEYRDLDRLAVAALCRKRPSPLRSGKPQTWACGILTALGQVNFLSDKTHESYLSARGLCGLLGIGRSTASAKAKVVSNALGLCPLHPDWILPAMLEHNPFAWFIEINGIIMDARSLPLEVQEAAFQEGLIPDVPGREERD